MPRRALALWERKLVFAIARKFELRDFEELQSELTRTIIDLKTKPPPVLRHWPGYLAKALHNRADTWSRRKRTIAKRELALPFSDPEIEGSLAAPREDSDLRVAFSALWQELDPDLQEFWHLLAEEKGNQAKVARRLGRHRNTIRSWMTKIQELLARHHLVEKPPQKLPSKPARPKAVQAVVISGPLFRKLTCAHLSGLQIRLLLWIILATFRRKQKTVPLNWTTIAHDLDADRRGVARAAKTLVTGMWLNLEAERIGLKRD